MHSHMKTTMRPWNPPSPDPEVVKRDKFHPIASGSVPLEFSPGLKQSIDNARKTVAQVVAEKLVNTPGPGSDVGIISLGTGGSMPSKYRNGKDDQYCIDCRSSIFFSFVHLHPYTQVGKHPSRLWRRNLGPDGSQFRIRRSRIQRMAGAP